MSGCNGCEEIDMPQGSSAYVYIAYADDNLGTGFTNTFDATKDWIAIKTTTTPITVPVVTDFTGLWKKYKGEAGINGAISREWMFSTNLVTSDPTATFLKFDDADVTFATELNISEVDLDLINVATLLALSVVSSSTIKSRIQITKKGDNSKFVLYNVTALVDNGVWDTISIAHVNSSSNMPFVLNDELVLSISITGDVGSVGATGTTLIPLTYPIDIVLPPAPGAIANTVTTYNIPANTMVATGDIIELEVDFVCGAIIYPIPNNGTGIVESDYIGFILEANLTGGWFFGGVETSALAKMKISFTRTGVNTGVVVYEAYSRYYSSVLLFTVDAGVVNYAANIPLTLTCNVNIGAASTINTPPYGQISRAIMKYYAA